MSKITPRFEKNKPGRPDNSVKKKMVNCARIWQFSWPCCRRGQVFCLGNILAAKFYTIRRLNSSRPGIAEIIEPKETKDKTMRYMRAYIDLCFEEHTLYEKGFIDEELWLIWKGGMKTAFSKPAFKQAWLAVQHDTKYNIKFEEFAEELGL